MLLIKSNGRRGLDQDQPIDEVVPSTDEEPTTLKEELDLF